MVAIESDIDATHIVSFRETMRFLRTEADTASGPGLGLDFVNSFWFYGPRPDGVVEDRMMFLESFAEPGLRSPHADEIEGYLRAGWAGVLHSFGRIGQDFRRDWASHALDRLDRLDVRPRIWTNHGRNGAQNILADGPDNPMIEGDLPGSPAYHADLLHAFGVRYFWNGKRGESTGGTKAPARPVKLRDGRSVWRFDRATGVNHAVEDFDLMLRRAASPNLAQKRPRTVVWQPNLLDVALSAPRLEALVRNRQFCIFAQHLGNLGGARAFPPAAVAALRRLKAFQDAGEILVASTARLLDFYIARAHADVVWRRAGDAAVLDIQAIDDPVDGKRAPRTDEVRGLSFRMPAQDLPPDGPRIALAGRAVPPEDIFVARDGADAVFGVRWHTVDHADHVAPALARQTPDPALAPSGADFAVGRDDRPFARMLGDAAAAMPPTERRTIAIVTAASLLGEARDSDPTARSDLLDGLHEDERRRLAALSGAAGPALPRDRAEIERAIYWAGMHCFGEAADASAPDDAIGVRDLVYLCRGVRRDAAKLLGVVGVPAAMAVAVSQVDWIAEVFGGSAALDILGDMANIAASKRARLRQMAFDPASDADALAGLAAATRGRHAAIDRLLAARSLAGRRAFAAAGRALGRIRTPEADGLRGWIAAAAGDTGQAQALYASAFDAAPADQSLLLGVLWSARETGEAVDFGALILRYLAAAEHAETAAQARLLAPPPLPLTARLKLWRRP